MKKDKSIIKAKQTALIAGVFTAFVALLLLLNYVQLKTTAPLDNAVIESLVERLSAEPNNEELMNEIRLIDLRSRKAYFTSLWQIQLGGLLMLIGGIVFILALRVYYKLLFAIPLPSSQKTDDSKTRLLTQQWIGISAVLIFVLALLAAYFSNDYLKTYTTQQTTVAEITDDGIEKIEIRRDSDLIQTDSLMAELEADTVPEAAGIIAALTEATVWQNHNAFRGPWGNGVSRHKNIPTDWDVKTGKNILWKTEIPLHGYNSPVLWGDRLFMSGADNDKRLVFCFDRHNGKLLWERKVDNIPGSPATAPKTTDDTGLAASTLTVDGQRVFAIFGTGDIIAFDFDGKRLWARNLGVPANHYGHSSSLLVWHDKVFVQYDTQRGSRVLALDAATGKTVWETPRTNNVSWGSPLLAKVNNKFQLVLLALPTLSSYDIETGRQLWSLTCMSGEVGTSPAYGGGLIYAANEYARMVAVNPLTGEKVWEDNYYLPEVSSPVYDNDLLYIATTFALVACFDAKTGEFIWEYDTKDGFYSSPMIADGKLFVFDMKGNAYIFKPGREPRLIATHHMGEPVFATPVFAEGRMYIRGDKNLYCIGKK